MVNRIIHSFKLWFLICFNFSYLCTAPAIDDQPESKATVAVLGHFRGAGGSAGKEDGHRIIALSLHTGVVA